MPISKTKLEALRARGLKHREIAEVTGLGLSTVKNWASKHGVTHNQTQLSVASYYAESPMDEPFTGLDRAEELGFQGAESFAMNKMRMEAMMEDNRTGA